MSDSKSLVAGLSIRAWVAGAALFVKSPVSDYERCRSIGSGRWNPQEQAWYYPATPAFAQRIALAFSGRLKPEDSFTQLLGRYALSQQAEKIRQTPANALPEIPLRVLKPWAHQLIAYHFVTTLWGRSLNTNTGTGSALLAMDMGTGKTRCAVDLIANLGFRRILIICPLSVIDVWAGRPGQPGEFEKHCPIPVRVVPLGDGFKSIAARTELALKELRAAEQRKIPLIICINYQAFWRPPFSELALNGPWDLVIYDEAHALQDPGGRASRFAASLVSRIPYRLGLTGTPMKHSFEGIYGLFRALDPGIYGTSFSRFRQFFGVMGGYEGRQVVSIKNQDDLMRRFYSIAYRVEAKDVLDLPETLDVQRMFMLGPEAQKAYKDLEKNFITWLRTGGDESCQHQYQ